MTEPLVDVADLSRRTNAGMSETPWFVSCDTSPGGKCLLWKLRDRPAARSIGDMVERFGWHGVPVFVLYVGDGR